MLGKIIEINKAGKDWWLKIKWENGLVTEKMSTDVIVMRG